MALHHIHPWLQGGKTDLTNLVLLCRKHHTLLHHTPWQVHLHNGRPKFIPPKWIDPHQHPIPHPLRP